MYIVYSILSSCRHRYTYTYSPAQGMFVVYVEFMHGKVEKYTPTKWSQLNKTPPVVSNYLLFVCLRLLDKKKVLNFDFCVYV